MRQQLSRKKQRAPVLRYKLPTAFSPGFVIDNKSLQRIYTAFGNALVKQRQIDLAESVKAAQQEILDDPFNDIKIVTQQGGVDAEETTTDATAETVQNQ